MFPRHRRRSPILINETSSRPRFIVRLVSAFLVVLIVWYLVSLLISFFDGSAGRKSPAILTMRGGVVEVSLQESEWQRAESNLPLHAGDAVKNANSSDTALRFFDQSVIRIDQNTEVAIDESDKSPDGTSKIELALKGGRLWVQTPNALTFTGSITRTLTTQNFSAEIPPDTAAIMSTTLIHVLKSSGLGVKLTLPFLDNTVVYVGEGQYFTLTEDARAKMQNGADPYLFRDPATQALLSDPFLVTSLSKINEQPPTSGSMTSSSGSTTTEEKDLVLTSPAEGTTITTQSITVSGHVSNRISSVLINGEAVNLKADRSFSVSMTVPSAPTMALHVEAKDAQGIPLSTIDRTLANTYKVSVEPVRIKAPVGSGETLDTSNGEVEISGEAPANTASIVVNDYTLQLFKPGNRTWSYLASAKLGNLKSGPNLYTIYAQDAVGNRSPGRSITINYSGNVTGSGSTAEQPPLRMNPPITPGVLTVDKPEPGTSTTSSEKEIVIEGRTSAETASISVNGYTLSLYQAGKTTWNYIASTDLQTMKRGKNVYRIVARNASGEVLDILEYTIDFRP